MTELFYYICDFLCSAAKIGTGFGLVAAFLEPACGERTERLVVALSVVGIAALNAWNNYLASGLFSNSMLFLYILFMALVSSRLYRGRKSIFLYAFAIWFLFLVGLTLADSFVLTFLYFAFQYFSMDPNVWLSVSLYRAFYLLLWSVLILAVGRYFCPRMKRYKNEVFDYLKKIWILYPLFLCGMIYFQRIYLREFSYQMMDRWWLFLLALILVMSGYVFSRVRSEEIEKMRLMQQRVDQLGSYYRTLSHTYEEKAVLLHDLRNHMRALRELLQSGLTKEAVAYLDQMEGVIRESGRRNLTNHDILDLILNAKLQEVREEGVEVYFESDDMKELQLNPMEICTVFCNLLDNGMEAIRRNREVKGRWIRLFCERKDKLLILSISNPTDEKTLKYDGEFPVSTKADKRLHGMGLRSIRQVLDAHQGHMNLTIEDQVFCFTAYMEAF